MGFFTRDRDDLPSEDEISEYLAFAGCDLDDDEPAPATTRRAGGHPYGHPATGTTPTWRGGPPLDHETELAYLREQDDRD